MRYARFITLIAVLLLAITPLAVLAQDGPEVDKYESEDGVFFAEYPAGWVLYVDEETPLPNVVFLNDEDSLALYESGNDLVSGDTAVFVFVMPTEVFALFGFEVTDDMAAAEAVEIVALMFIEPGEDEDATVLGEGEEFELEDGRVVGYLDVEDDATEGGFFLFELGEDLAGVAMIVTFPGEYDEDAYALAEAVVESVEFTGSADDVLSTLFGEATEDDGDMGGDAAMLVEERCSTCHSTDRIYEADKDEAGWTETVDRMIDYGAQFDDAERAAVIEYLASIN